MTMYGKIFASLYQGTLRGRAAEILVFTNMIACCDKGGEVDKHPRAIADEVGLPLDQVHAAIATLEAPDPESRSRDHDGARIVRVSTERTWGWVIVNHAKYRAIRNEDDRREQNREAVRRHRANVSHGKPPSSNVIHGKPKKAQSDAGVKSQESEAGEQDAHACATPSTPPDGNDLFPATNAQDPRPRPGHVPKVDWQHWRQTHPRIWVSRSDEDGSVADWQRLLTRAGNEPMNHMYDALTKALAREKKINLGQALAWIDANYED
jgi:hypothetical protein